MKDQAEFVLHVGPMWGAKSGSMLRAIDRLELQGHKVAVFKAAADDRYSMSAIVTHDGIEREAYLVSDGNGIVEFLANSDEVFDVVAVDEAFMIKGVAHVLRWLYANGVTVHATSLDLSATLEPFDEVSKMLPWATRVNKLKAVCTVCGADAGYTYAKVELGEDNLRIGGSEAYEPRCAEHHPLFDSLKDE